MQLPSHSGPPNSPTLQPTLHKLGWAAATPSILSPPINSIRPKHPPYGSIDVPQSAHSSPGQQRVYNSRHGRGSGGWWIWNPVEPWNPVLQTCSYSLSGKGFGKQGSRVPKFQSSVPAPPTATQRQPNANTPPTPTTPLSALAMTDVKMSKILTILQTILYLRFVILILKEFVKWG